MTSHIAHPDTLVFGLVDGCPRCAEHAKAPLAGLDRPHIEDLWKRMLACEYDPFGPHEYRYRSEAEAEACHVLYDHAQFLRSVGVDPMAVTPGPGYPSLPGRRTPSEAAAEVIRKILDRVAGEPFVLAIVREGDEHTVSLSWKPDGPDAEPSIADATFGAEPDLVAALAFVAQEVGA